MLKSLAGDLFTVTSSQFIDVFLTVIRDKLAINDPMIDTTGVSVVPVIDTQRTIERERIEPDTHLCPTINWDVHKLYGMSSCQELSYDATVVPPPMNACVQKDITIDELLYSTRQFHHSGDPETQYLSSVEYNQLIVDSADINLLNAFEHYLRDVHE